MSLNLLTDEERQNLLRFAAQYPQPAPDVTPAPAPAPAPMPRPEAPVADPTAGLDDALAQDRSASAGRTLGQLLAQAASIYRGGQGGPLPSVKSDDAMREWLLKKQIGTQAEDRAWELRQRQRTESLWPVEDRAKVLGLYKTGAELDNLGADTAKKRADANNTNLQATGLALLDQPAWPQMLDLAKRYRLPTPPGVTNRQIKDALDSAGKAEGFAIDWAKLGLDRDRLAYDRAKPQGTPQTVQGLRQEFQGQQTYKDTQQIAAAYKKILQAGASGAGDMSLIYGYMKLVDPGSTVREGEFANANNSGGISDKVRTLYNKALNGERLSPNVRNDFRREAEALMRAQLGRYAQLADQYRRLATQAGFKPEDVVLDMGLGDVNRGPEVQLTGTGRRTVTVGGVTYEEE